MIANNDFTSIYRALLTKLLMEGIAEKNERTGTEIYTLEGASSFKLDLEDGHLRLAGTRRFYPRTAAAEVAWFLSGSQDVTWLRRYAPIWDKFVEDDGVTIESAYGYRWRQHFGRDQIACAATALKLNPSDRRILISAWDPAQDGLGAFARNVPCPASFTLSIVDGRLHSSLFIRSSDVFVGLPYDVMGHALLLAAFAASLKVKLGTMHVTLAHPHLYALHREMVVTTLRQRDPDVFPQLGTPYLEHVTMPDDWTLERIATVPDAYVTEIARRGKLVAWPDWAPRPEVVV